MLENINSANISQVIQLSVAPVFMLAGISSILGVMINRLARIVDRARLLEAQLASASEDQEPVLRERLGTLAQRARLVSVGVALCTFTALLVSSVVITLFIGAFFSFKASIPAALLFICALISFVLSLVWFLREIFLASAHLKIGVTQARRHPTQS